MGTEYEPLAQQAEHLTFNQRVWSSNLQWLTSTTADVLNHVSFSFFQKHDRRYHIITSAVEFSLPKKSRIVLTIGAKRDIIDTEGGGKSACPIS